MHIEYNSVADAGFQKGGYRASRNVSHAPFGGRSLVYIHYKPLQVLCNCILFKCLHIVKEVSGSFQGELFGVLVVVNYQCACADTCSVHIAPTQRAQ